MEVRELKDTLAAFNPAATIAVAIPSGGTPHEVRAIKLVGHIDHPDEVKTDHTVHALDIMCDSWDAPASGGAMTVADFVAALDPFPDPMHTRVAVPLAHDSISHRMLDIVMLGHMIGAGSGIQLVCESWDNPMQVVKAITSES